MPGDAVEGDMTGAADLCIVMPVFDEAAQLARHLEPLQPLRRHGARLVVVDGGSRDASPAIARGLADQVVESARGRAVQMNAGARHCVDAGTLLFLHADTQLPDDADRLIETALSKSAQWGRFDVAIDSPRRLLAVVGWCMNRRSCLTGIATGDQAMFVRREVFEAVGGFAEIALMEDIELSQRLRHLGRPACIRECVRTSARRWEEHGVWPTVWLMWRLRAAYFLGADPARLAERYGYRGPDD